MLRRKKDLLLRVSASTKEGWEGGNSKEFDRLSLGDGCDWPLAVGQGKFAAHDLLVARFDSLELLVSPSDDPPPLTLGSGIYILDSVKSQNRTYVESLSNVAKHPLLVLENSILAYVDPGLILAPSAIASRSENMSKG